MSCACIKHRDFNLHVDFIGCERLVIEDQSIWVGDSLPETYDLVVSVPSRIKDHTVKIYTGKRNIFTTKEFFDTNEELTFPDEIYCFSTTTCNNVKLSITRAVMCKAYYGIQEIVSKYAPTMLDSELKEIAYLKLLYEEIAINAERGNVNEANILYKTLKNRLKDLNCESCR